MLPKNIINVNASYRNSQSLYTAKKVNVGEFFFFFKLGFTPGKAEQPLRGMELQETKQKRLQDTENLFRKNLQLKDVC